MGILDVARAMQEAERQRLAAEGGGADIGGYPVTPGIKTVFDTMRDISAAQGQSLVPPKLKPRSPLDEILPAWTRPTEVSAYRPTGQDEAAWLLRGVGVPRESARGITGSVGLGNIGGQEIGEGLTSQGTSGSLSLADLFPPTAAAIYGPQSQEEAKGGNALAAGLDVLNAVPILGPDAKLTEMFLKGMLPTAEKAAVQSVFKPAVVPELTALTHAQTLHAAGEHPSVIHGLTGMTRDPKGNWTFGPPPPPKQISGAPEGVMTPEHEAERQKDYLKTVEVGFKGWPWYIVSGKENLAHTAADPVQAMRLAGVQAATSSQTTVPGNAAFAAKGYQQGVMGVPIETGHYPVRMSRQAQSVMDAADPYSVLGVGQKWTPFAQNIIGGGGYGPAGTRPVNDLWQGRAWGYSPAQVERGFKPPHHAWMDAQTYKAIDEANKMKLGGKGDWDVSSIQAAAWVGQRIKEGMDPAEALVDFQRSWGNTYGFQPVEYQPGSSVVAMGHNPIPVTAPPEKKQAYFNQMNAVNTNPVTGRDVWAEANKALTGPDVQGTGFYINDAGVMENNPMKVVPTAEGREAYTGKQTPESLLQMQGAAHGRGLVSGQNAVGGFVPGTKDVPQYKTDIVNMPLRDQRPVTRSEIFDLAAIAKKHLPPEIFAGITPQVTPEGVRLHYHNNGEPISAENHSIFARAGQKIADELSQGTAKVDQVLNRNVVGSFYTTNDFRTQKYGENYIDIYRNNPMLRERFDNVAPRVAAGMMKVDNDLGVGKTNMQELRRIIAEGGFQGIIDAINKGTLPVAAGALAFGLAHQILAQDDQSQGGPLGATLGLGQL